MRAQIPMPCNISSHLCTTEVCNVLGNINVWGSTQVITPAQNFVMITAQVCIVW
jgi:hypothetical protein